MHRVSLTIATAAAVLQLAAPQPVRKHVLAWADVRNGYQHDSISHALATIERLGRESGAYLTYIRTDSQLLTKQPISVGERKNINAKNLNFFDAIFYMGTGEGDLTTQQKADLLSFIKEDGRASSAHTPAMTRISRGRSSERWSAAISTAIRGAFSMRRLLWKMRGFRR
jgi:hypothetical protein